jgi:hypothetical protein
MHERIAWNFANAKAPQISCSANFVLRKLSFFKNPAGAPRQVAALKFLTGPPGYKYFKKSSAIPLEIDNGLK